MNQVDRQRLNPFTNCGMARLPDDMALAKIRSPGAGANLVCKIYWTVINSVLRKKRKLFFSFFVNHTCDFTLGIKPYLLLSQA
jgi:hypothetical protein